MIKLKSQREITLMRKAGEITAAARAYAGKMVTAGITTREIDRAVHDFIVSKGAVPTFLNYSGYPASCCLSVNEELIHGIPSEHRILKEGDIVSVDVGAFIDGYTGDNAATYPVGEISEEAKKLLRVTKESLDKAVEICVAGNRLGDIGSAVQTHVEDNGFSVVREYVGHGVGRELHEDPEVPNYGKAGHGVRLVPGMTIAIEPMVNAGGPGVEVLANDWTVVTKDRRLSAHFEYTVAITENGPIIMTRI